MNTRLSMILAGVLLVGALFAGYWGLVLSREPAPAPPPPPQTAPVEKAVAVVEDQTRQPVVVLAHDVPPFVALNAADLSVEKLRTVPAGSMTSVDQAIGRTPWRALQAGTWLNEESFTPGGPLARMIRPDERALAVAVDEVIGAAGQLSPGDYVDVLLYLRQDTANLEQSAQVVVPAMRLLSVGDQMGLTNDGTPASPPAMTAEEKAQRRAPSRTVVLAVPEQLLSRLMLASQAGTLRLAVRSADERLLSQYWAGESDAPGKLQSANRDLYQFTQLAFAQAPKKVAQSAPHRTGVEVIRGNQATQQTPD
ncbi:MULTISPECIES: Flp pilus assembly protein CpaB [Pseudomonas]|uniref:Flp pilus assembly protein CpaB n=1 Tax=Pseudomonas TaxID=286 RepID=UPI000D0CA710|nr:MULTISPECIES: Flp pilus assembly protein CpaB [unclassified Pseudomonas]MBT0626505.1 Flp pilus assembly protein CpaB [Pseudomonas fluorescens]MBK3508146.1 Flp pilus assembly protein CpaB [Pseudomonas sp. MF6747]MCU1779031.1 Flp pilus assembly protein CpaB [Pseudomonas sp. 14P_5.3_Bac1]PSL94190.1 Flp pilus assembly protein CpaB [Pseudomonas sp. R9.37]TVT92009.1 Flp pilus assembly protein CpaB [Pseudomonas sp. RGB]